MVRQRPTLRDSFTIRGQWWLPEYPDDRVVGTLSFDGSHEPELELLRCFKALPARALLEVGRKSTRLPILAGQSDDGGYWSALGCLPDSFGTEDAQSVHFYCAQVLSGLAPRSSDQIQFKEVRVQFSKVAEWFSAFPDQSVEIPNVQINFSMHPNLVMDAQIASPQGRLTVEQSFNPLYIPGRLTIHSQATWSFGFELEAQLKEVFRTVRDCQNLVSFLIGEPSDVERMIVVARNSTVTSEFKGGLQAADVIASMTRSPSDGKFSPVDALFQLQDLGGEPSRILSNWFSAQQQFRDVIAFLLASQYVRGYATTEFLNLTQALESFHRRSFGGRYYPVDEYDTIQQRLVSAIPPTLIDNFKQRLKSTYEYANEYSLRRRLIELFSSLGPNAAQRISLDIKAFTETVVKTRNYLTHLDEKNRTASLMASDDLGNLFRANRILRAVANTLIAKQIGIDIDVAVQRAFRLMSPFGAD